MPRPPRSALPLLLILALASCGDQLSGPGSTAPVRMNDHSFAPQTLQIQRGTTVRWENRGTVQHNAVAENGSFNTGTVEPNGSASHRFDGAGTFPYRCTLHAGMTGTILVD